RRALDDAAGVGVMVDHELPHTDIPNADPAGHVARHTGEEDLLSPVAGDEDLGGGGGVGLTHAGAADHHLLVRQAALVVHHPGVFLPGHVGQSGAQLVHLGGHRLHNSDDHGALLTH